MTGIGPSDGAAFLPEREPLSWTAPAGFPVSLRPAALYLQDANPGLEVAVATAARPPGAVDLRAAWRKRQAGRPNPVLLIALYGTAGEVRAALCGPVGEQPPVHTDVALSRARRLAAAALGEPTHQAATRFLLAALGEVRSEMPGLRNVGLLATQQLLVTAAAIRSGGRPLARGPATAAVVGSPAGDAAALLELRGRPLVEALGFEVQALATGASLLRIDGRGRAVAVFCDEGEPFDAPAGRFEGTSPVSRGLSLADTENLDWLVLTRGAEIRLYAARGDVGVGRKGRAESFVELNLALLADDLADFLPLLFSADALRQGGSLEVLLAESAVFAARWPATASTAWTATGWRWSWPACPSGSTRSCRACRCRCWTTTSSAATASPASEPSTRQSPRWSVASQDPPKLPKRLGGPWAQAGPVPVRRLR